VGGNVDAALTHDLHGEWIRRMRDQGLNTCRNNGYVLPGSKPMA
jgi:hypothetical protein